MKRRPARLKKYRNKTLSEYFDTVVQLVPNIASLKPGISTLFRQNIMMLTNYVAEKRIP